MDRNGLSPVQELDDEEIDSEWDDFDRLLSEYKVRRRNVPQSPLLSRRQFDEYYKQSQEPASFYPCPPPAATSEILDPFDYVQTAVSNFSFLMPQYLGQCFVKLGTN